VLSGTTLAYLAGKCLPDEVRRMFERDRQVDRVSAAHEEKEYYCLAPKEGSSVVLYHGVW